MEYEILDTLKKIEQEKDVKILYASEAGSRAYGLESQDSDYDVRFIYLRSKDWYLSINVENKKDVIERSISDHLDLSGWDLRKALKLLYKSNPNLIEWLQSKHIYADDKILKPQLLSYAKEKFSERAYGYHYRNMAKNNLKTISEDLNETSKIYLSALRASLSLRWLFEFGNLVPISFNELLNQDLDSELTESIQSLVRIKKTGIDAIDTSETPDKLLVYNFCKSVIEDYDMDKLPMNNPKMEISELDDIFAQQLD